MSATLDRLTAALAGRYAVERELGAGGMATVYLAEDVKHRRKVAVKVLRAEVAAAIGAERFRREIDVAARLQHPHILPLLDSGQADGFYYYVMPYVKGESLRERLDRRGELPVRDALRVLIQVTDALAHAHAHGVVHRDIKPDNVLLSDRHALVTDFGVAKAVAGADNLTAVGVTLGTPAYMAPEQAAGDPNLDQRTDVYAVGVLGYELLTGRPPFTGLTPQETLAAQVTRAPEPVEARRSGVSPAFAVVLMRCLAKRPADRWQTADELLAQLERLVTRRGSTPTATRPPVAPDASPSPVLVAFLAVVGASVLLGAGVLVARRSAPEVPQFGRRWPVTIDPGVEIDPSLSPDGRFVAYVAGPLGHTRLQVRQVEGGMPIHLVRDSSGRERFPYWSRDGQQILFQSRRGIEVVPVLGGPSRLVIAAGGASPIPGPVAPDGGHFVYASQDSLFVAALENPARRFLTTGKELHSLSWSTDGRWIAFVSGNVQYVSSQVLGNIAESSIWVVSADGGTPVRVTDDRSLNVSPVWAPGRVLLFVSNRDGGREVYRIALGRSGAPASEPVRLTTGLNAHGISTSADGKRLAYSLFTETSNVWWIAIPPPGRGAVSVSQARALTAGNQTIEGFAISPDGRWLGFDSNRSGRQQVYRVRLDGGEPEQLTRDSMDDFRATWSPDGLQLAYHSFRGGRRQVFVASVEGGTSAQVTAGADDQRTPEWSPDGRSLLVHTNTYTSPALHLIARTPTGWSAPRLLPLVLGSDTVAPQPGISATWSPDSRYVACFCDGLVVIPVAGGPARRLVPGTSAGRVDWSDDGRTLYYLSSDATGLTTVNAIPAAGGTPRVVVRFDDPARPWHRYGLRVRGSRLYFTLGDLQSDIWVTDLEPR
ncbi:MAG TPA: protein kinase [Gemmatimonadales bacterium]